SRPLTDRGRRDATRVGELLRRLSLVPDLIITSDAVRAHTTARIVADAARYSGKIVMSSSLYHASPDAVVEVLRTVKDPVPRAIMIVAHNPGLEDLVTQLTGEDVALPTAALVQVEVAVDRWSHLELSANATLIDTWGTADL
ncbi:MAG: SixA phosphatase family protein, partial [Vicinamibacterales bacterium]